jgi:acyl carrier protein
LLLKLLQLQDKELTPETHFVKDMGIDSLDTVELTLIVQDALDCEIPGYKFVCTINSAKPSSVDKVDSFATLGDVIKFVQVCRQCLKLNLNHNKGQTCTPLSSNHTQRFICRIVTPKIQSFINNNAKLTSFFQRDVVLVLLNQYRA